MAHSVRPAYNQCESVESSLSVAVGLLQASILVRVQVFLIVQAMFATSKWLAGHYYSSQLS